MPYQLLPTKLYARHLHKQQHGDGEDVTLASSQNLALVSVQFGLSMASLKGREVQLFF